MKCTSVAFSVVPGIGDGDAENRKSGSSFILSPGFCTSFCALSHCFSSLMLHIAQPMKSFACPCPSACLSVCSSFHAQFVNLRSYV